MASMNVYLYFNGNCEEALNFYKEKLGGEVLFMQRFEDAPMDMPEGEKKRIMHAYLKAGEIEIMFSDTSGGEDVKFGSNMHLSLNCNSVEEEDRLFAALSEGGKVTMPIEKTFWGSRFGTLRDRFGVYWMLSYDEKKQS